MSKSTEGFPTRLGQAIDAKKISNAALAAQCGIKSPGLLRNYLQGTSLPGMEILASLTEVLDVSLVWLVYGEGEMRSDSTLLRSLPGYPEVGVVDVLETMEMVLRCLDGRVLPPEKTREAVTLAVEIFAEEARKNADPTQAKKSGQERVERTLRLVSNG